MIPLAFNPNHATNPATNLSEMSLAELQEIALRQQQQIEINQQLLMAKEKRLNLLKLEEAKNQQLTLLTSNLINTSTTTTNPKLENLKQNAVLSQELKIYKLKQLKSQMLDFKLSNSNMYSELDLIKNLFSDKERDLYKAINKVNELTKQIEQLRRLKTNNKAALNSNNASSSSPQSNNNITELERLKQELQIRNKLNEQQSKKIQQQQELFNKKQGELVELDRRIDELKNRIKNKRNRLQSFHQQQHQQQQISAADIEKSPQLTLNDNSKPSSPSKVAAKFATKQEIANTYMNKYRMTTATNPSPSPMMMMMQQQQQQTPLQNQLEIASNSSTSNTSSITSSLPSPPQPSAQTQQQNENVSAAVQSSSSQLPSHLKLEFDKMKYLPDMVKTIKKRHSISEIEGSGSTIPPFIVQKILEKHKEFNNNNNNNSNSGGLNKLARIAENVEPNQQHPHSAQIIPILTSNNNNSNNEDQNSQPPKLTTFMSNNVKPENVVNRQESKEQT
jgi:hypothetical protein